MKLIWYDDAQNWPRHLTNGFYRLYKRPALMGLCEHIKSKVILNVREAMREGDVRMQFLSLEPYVKHD
jgi:hypothetical protein